MIRKLGKIGFWLVQIGMLMTLIDLYINGVEFTWFTWLAHGTWITGLTSMVFSNWIEGYVE